MEGDPDVDVSGVERLPRFDADQLRAIESALADHLALDTTYLAADGFSVVPDGDHGLKVLWRGSARIDSATFTAIVATATAGDESGAKRWREHLPEPAGAPARPRRFRRRRRPGDPTVGATPDDQPNRPIT
jgi:hypothetical protein